MGMTNWAWLAAHPDEESVFNAAMARRAGRLLLRGSRRRRPLRALQRLHDGDDERAVGILRTVAAAMGDGARLLVVETVLEAPGRTPGQQRDVHLVDLHLLVMFGACERTRAGYDALFTAAGLAASTTAPSPNTWNVLVTHAAGR